MIEMTAIGFVLLDLLSVETKIFDCCWAGLPVDNRHLFSAGGIAMPAGYFPAQALSTFYTVDGMRGLLSCPAIIFALSAFPALLLLRRTPPSRARPAGLRVAALAAWFATASGAAASDANVTFIARSGTGQAQIEAILHAARATGQPVTLRWDDAPVPVPGPNGAMAAALGARLLEAFQTGLAERVRGAGRLAELPRDVAAAWGHGSDSAVALVLLLAAAALAALALGGMLPAPPAAEPAADVLQKLRISGARLARDGVALAAFAGCGLMGTQLLFGDPDVAQALAERALRAGAVIGLYAVAGRFLLAPGDEGRRLLPLPRAEWHFRMLMAYAVCGAIVDVVAAGAQQAGTAPAVLDGWFLVGCTALTLLKAWWFWAGRHDIATLFAGGECAGALRKAAAVAWPWLLMVIAVVIWGAVIVVEADPQPGHWVSAAADTQVIAILLPILALGIGECARALGQRRAAAAPPTAPAGRSRPSSQAMRRAAGAAGRTVLIGGIWLAGLFHVARLWGVPLDTSGSGVALATLVRIGAAIVTGLTLWTFLRAYFAAHLPVIRGGPPGEDDEGEHLIQSRLTTVLPILRDLTLGAVIAATALIVLSSLGIDIAPLLAGFGVVGLAISFGSQALVRDIVSGIFFMSDDAFRLGEYVDTGRLKGSVEKITLRSVQLRHQNGQIHTIPFGQLQAVTNFSRDWSTVKFTLRLDRDADIEKARKTIKKVGQAMLVDCELGPEFILPLKMQGLQDIADNAIVVRCKFTCKPSKPTWLQREALKRLHKALQDAGVPLASNSVLVRTHPQEANGADRSATPAAHSGAAAVHLASQATTAA